MTEDPNETMEQVPEEPSAPERTADSGETPPEVFGPEDHVLFVGRQQREYLRRLKPGQKVEVKGEYFDAEAFIGLPVGSSVVTPQNIAYLALRPTLSEVVMNMPREAQIIYPKDLGPILYYADVRPGARVLEVGTGHGAMTLSLVRAVGPSGEVVSYERRGDHARRTRQNVRKYLGETPWWQVKVADPAETGFEEGGFDLAVIDVPAPWEIVPRLPGALKASATAAFFLPNVPQVVQLAESLRETGKFAHLKTFELLQRPWNVEGLSVRPQMHISGHTGFITLARRKLGEVVKLPKPPSRRAPRPEPELEPEFPAESCDQPRNDDTL